VSPEAKVNKLLPRFVRFCGVSGEHTGSLEPQHLEDDECDEKEKMQ
jgi:hypothetical protein